MIFLMFGIGQRLGDELHLGDLAPDVLAEAVGERDGDVAVAGLADRVLPALHRQRLLVGREAGGGAFEGLGDDRVDVVGGAQRLHLEFLLGHGLGGKSGKRHHGAGDAGQRPFLHFAHVFLPILFVLFTARLACDVQASFHSYLPFSQGYRAVSLPA